MKSAHDLGRTRRLLLPSLIATVALASCVPGDGAGRTSERIDGPTHGTERLAPCEVPKDLLRRVWRGFVPELSGDVVAIERLPNQFGSRHSSPHPYAQNIPLVMWGPGYVRAGATIRKPATLADIAPTQAELLGFPGWPDDRPGRTLTEALVPAAERVAPPRLIFTVVWDGGGDNVLRRWKKDWPVLRKLMRTGSTFTRATVGSSPSITPAAHANIGTGAFPQQHGVPDIMVEIDGKIVDVWQGGSPRNLKLDTLGDMYDLALGNRPKIGMLARDFWQVGLVGHGAFNKGADRDVVVLDDLDGLGFHTNGKYYRLPAYMEGTPGLENAVDEVDRRDGRRDRRWLGERLDTADDFLRKTPVWPIYQTQRIAELVRREGFGKDSVPDLFFTNYKSTDLAGHQWNMIEREVQHNLREQDAQLDVLIDLLDREVGRGRYVLMITADHGMTPRTFVRDAWNIDDGEMTADIEARFNEGSRRPLLLANRRYALMLDEEVAGNRGVDPADIANFIRNYRLRHNAPDPEEVSPPYSQRLDEHLYLTAMTPEQLERSLRCDG